MLTIHTYPLGPLQTNCYLIHNATSALVIDPGGAPHMLIQYMQEKKLTLERIMCTHLHFDHTMGVAALCAQTKASMYASTLDKYMVGTELGEGTHWGFSVDTYTYTPLEAGTLTLLDTTCEVLATPGHSPGGLSYYFPAAQAVFSGDTLFQHSVGRTDLAGGESKTLTASIQKVLFALPGGTTVYPGHGDSSTIEAEKKHNPYVGSFAYL